MRTLFRKTFWAPIILPRHGRKYADLLLSTWLIPTWLLVTSTLCSIALADGEWGDLKGRFVYDGTVPTQNRLNITKDRAVFGNSVTDESLLVNDDNRGVANIVVYLDPPRGEETSIHPSYSDTAEAPIDLHIRNGRYSPRILLVRTTQTILERSFDTVGHNTAVQAIENAPPGRLVPAGHPVKHQFPLEERIPVPIQCNIHPWMRAFVLIRSNPYMAASTEDGYFEIENLPVGLRTFRIWHERVGFLRNVTVGSHKLDDRGRMTLMVSPGENNLNNVLLPGKLFELVSKK